VRITNKSKDETKGRNEMDKETIQLIIQNISKRINFATKTIVEAVNEIVMLEMEKEYRFITELEEGKLKNLYLKKERKERELQTHVSDISNLLKLLKKA
jgi:hypothetical protein